MKQEEIIKVENNDNNDNNDNTDNKDKDNIADYLDKCPDEAGKLELNGCPDKDSNSKLSDRRSR